MLTSSDVIAAIVSASDLSPDEKSRLESKLVLLCKLAREEQRKEFRRYASRMPMPAVLQ